MNTVASRPEPTDLVAQGRRQLLWLGGLALLGFLVLLFVLSSVAGMGSETGGSNPGIDTTGSQITLALREEPPQLDSTKATDQVSGFVLGHVMEGLLRFDEQNRLAPGVAERWEITERGATFWLRRNARWSNGETITAHDFVFSWRTAVDPANASEYAFIMYPVKNGEAINRGELPLTDLGVRAVDDFTLEVEFEKPIAYFDKLVVFVTYRPVQEQFYRGTNGRYGADADQMLYSGPFMIDRWVHGAHLRLVKNPNYWNADSIQLEVIDFPYITSDVNATLNLFKDGSIASTGLAAENLEDALNQRWEINRFMDGSVFYIEFNHREGRPTTSRHLRRAMQLVNDPSELVYKVIKAPGYLPGESLFPVWLRGAEGFLRQEYPAPVARVDIEAARRELELAKAELGVDEIPPLVLLSGDNPLSSKQSEYYQNLFRRTLGLDLRIDKQIFKQRLAKMTSGEFDLVLAGWGPDFDDPLTFGDLFASWNLNNRGRYANPELDRWVRVAQGSLDQAERAQAFGQIQQVLFDDAVLLYNYERGLVYVTDSRLQGIVRRQAGHDPDYTYAFINSAEN
ncbi:MAG: peptide ABC transporter substrate-binding protein [Pseudomonadota bacterium]